VNAELLSLTEIAPQAWKNGAGLTRELAASPAAGAFDWRISVAEITRDAPFSAFPGIDRCIMLLRGAGMQLRAGASAWQQRLDTPLQAFCFSGDDVVDSSLIDGDCSDLNVMVRRGCWRSVVSVVRAATAISSADAGLLLCCDGAWDVAGTQLVAMQALLWRSAMPALRVEPLHEGASLVVVRLCQDGAR